MTRGSRVDFAVNSLITSPKVLFFIELLKLYPFTPSCLLKVDCHGFAVICS